MATDEQLLARLGSDPQAFELFYRRHVGMVVRFAARRTASPEEAADLVAAVFLALIESSHRFDPRRGPALPWVLGVAANQAAALYRDNLRESRTRERIAGRRLLDADDYARLEERIDAERAARRLYAAMAQLSDGQRRLLELVVLEGCTPAEAARAVGISGASARMRLARARRTLRRRLATEGRPPPGRSKLSPAMASEEAPT
ncbi:MAG TPA: sigma-70 family RNA polymerase sigma factor [Egibacteraceae bacterium]|nr:sigma-70 family RNA polymerase sigma factor [Egibacteraceae bacterium]